MCAKDGPWRIVGRCYNLIMVIGVDEVGRGCWAGPLVAAAVGFLGRVPEGLSDSKKLSAKRRMQLAQVIQNATEYIGIGWVWPKEINKLGLTKSVQVAMQRAYNALPGLPGECQIIVDGNINYLSHISRSKAEVRADGSVSEVSAASIVAKVARDAYMQQIALKYQGYGFEAHVGYGTRQHVKALQRYGVLPIHRVHYKPIRALLAT